MENKIIKVPNHLAVIMDGNGRWAKKRNKNRVYGHTKGIIAVRKIVEESVRLEIKYLTLYAFSTENWNRPVYEVKALMNLFKYHLNKKLTQLHQENVKVTTIGDMDPFPKIIKKYVQNLTELTKNNDGMYLNLALNYGGRAEIVELPKE